jgi:hypothetical protein
MNQNNAIFVKNLIILLFKAAVECEYFCIAAAYVTLGIVACIQCF